MEDWKYCPCKTHFKTAENDYKSNGKTTWSMFFFKVTYHSFLSSWSFSICHHSTYNASTQEKQNKKTLSHNRPFSQQTFWNVIKGKRHVISNINNGSVQVSRWASMHNTRILKLKLWNCFSYCDMLKYLLWKIGPKTLPLKSTRMYVILIWHSYRNITIFVSSVLCDKPKPFCPVRQLITNKCLRPDRTQFDLLSRLSVSSPPRWERREWSIKMAQRKWREDAYVGVEEGAE